MVTRFEDTRRKPTAFQKVTALQVGRCENGGKFKYQSKGDARRAYKLQPGKTDGRRNRPYACPYCGAWHLTSEKQVDERSREAGL